MNRSLKFRIIRLTILFFVAIGLLLVSFSSDKPTKKATTQAKEIHKSQVTTPHSDKVVLHPQHAEFTTELHSPETDPEDDLGILQELLRLHRQAHRENPVGLNDEITAALLGQNAKNYALLPRNSPFLSQEFHPQLLDRWGTPYRFHALSAKEMEVSSAGPDKAHHTQDDLTLSP